MSAGDDEETFDNEGRDRQHQRAVHPHPDTRSSGSVTIVTDGLGGCLYCGKPTRSHPVAGEVICHACFARREPREILEDADANVREDLRRDTPLTCGACGYTQTPEEAKTSDRGLRHGSTDFEQLDRTVTVACPACGEAETYYTTTPSLEALYSRNDGGKRS